MKRTLIALSVFFAGIGSAGAAYSPGMNEFLSWADAKINTIRQDLRDASRGTSSDGTNAYCVTQQDWRPQFVARWRLGWQETEDYIEVLWGKNACLRRDILEIENRIGQVTEAVFRLKPACLEEEDAQKLNETFEEITLFIRQLSFFKDVLLKYSDIDASQYEPSSIIRDYNNVFGSEMPEALQKVLPLSHQAYFSEEECPEPQEFFSFMQAKAQLAILMRRIEDLKEMGKGLTDISGRFAEAKSYFDEERLEQIRKRARYRASAWFENNIVRNIQMNFSFGPVFIEGSQYIGKSEAEQRRQKERNAAKIESKAPDAVTPKEVLAEEPVQPAHEVVEKVEQSNRNREDTIRFNMEIDDILLHVGEIDRVLLETLDRNPVKILQTFEKKNEFIEEATDAVRDLCNSMPTCE